MSEEHPERLPTPEEMRRVAIYVAAAMGLHLVARRIGDKANELEAELQRWKLAHHE